MTALRKNPKIGLALGGGAARGLAHIPMLEAFDELGITPSVIAGCSIGALVGAAYASGISGKDLREHATKLLSNRIDLLRHLFGQKGLKPQNLLSLQGLTSLHVKGDAIAKMILPAQTKSRIEETLIPLRIVATNYSEMTETVFTAGLMNEAIAASIAIPGIISGPVINGHIHVDGGVTNPVPFNHAKDGMDIVVAIDVTGKPKPAFNRHPSNIELAVGSLMIMFHQQADMRRALNPPDIYVTPDVDQFGSAEFFRVKELFKVAEPAKERLKRSLDMRLSKV
jgi:NTE family protein